MTALRIDTDVVRWAVDGRAASADEAIAALSERPLLLLMHGYGSFEGDLIGLASQLPKGFVCASPRAPLVAPPPIENGYAWWQLPLDANGLPARTPRTAEFIGSPEHTAALAILEWLDVLEARVAASTDAPLGEASLNTVALMGFSQGGAMVTSLLRLRPTRFASGVNCSGFVAEGSYTGDAELAKVRPPMFWGRDPADPIIDSARIAKLSEWAPAHTELETHLYDGIAHGIGREEIVDISDFLKRHVAGAQRDGAQP